MNEQAPTLKHSHKDDNMPITCLGTVNKESRVGHFKILGNRQLEKVLALHAEVMKQLPDQSLYIPYSLQEMSDFLNRRNGFVLGFFDDDELVAFRVTTWPGENPKNLGCHLQLSAKQLAKVIQLEGTNVHPLYRGNNLQRILTEKSIEYLNLPSGETPVLTAVSPYNEKSLINMMSWGMKIVAMKDGNSSMVRLVLKKTLGGNQKPESLQWKNHRWIYATDIQNHQQCLKESFQGFRVKRLANQHLQICYGQPK